MKLYIDVPSDLFKEFLTISKDKTLSEYIIQLMKSDLRRQNIKDGLAVQMPSKPIISGLRTIKEGEFKIITKIFNWLKEKYKSDHKYIKIRLDKNWPRKRHD